jgi:hypothetical protein
MDDARHTSSFIRKLVKKEEKSAATLPGGIGS